MFNLLVHSVQYKGRLTKISILEGFLKKNSLWASRLWVGRRKDLILSYATKNNKKKKSSCINGLKKIEIYKYV